MDSNCIPGSNRLRDTKGNRGNDTITIALRLGVRAAASLPGVAAYFESSAREEKSTTNFAVEYALEKYRGLDPRLTCE